MTKKTSSRKVLRSRSSPKLNSARQKNSRSQKNAKEKTAKINKILLLVVFFSIITFTIINVIAMMNTLKYKTQDQLIDNTRENASEDTLIANPKDSNTNTSPETITEKETADQTFNEKEALTETKPSGDTQALTQKISAQGETQDKKTSELTLFFIEINETGTPIPKKETRKVPFTTAVLTASLNELFKGPQTNELANFIPKGSAINSISLSSGIANLDFNEDFQYNDYGFAGILAQLLQLVYTCTEIPNINSVQITINKKKIKYFGGEGAVELDKPLTRAYLNTFF